MATPNDDGVNDELVAEFTVVLLGDNETVEMEIYDLSGHLVRRLSQSRVVSAGRYRMAWDGLNESDRLCRQVCIQYDWDWLRTPTVPVSTRAVSCRRLR